MLRVKKLLLDGERCELCGSTLSLQVHHKTYENLFHENLDDLQVLCVKCHARIRAAEYRKRHFGIKSRDNNPNGEGER